MRRKNVLVKDIDGIQRQLDGKAKDLDQNERDHWESIIGEIYRTIQGVNIKQHRESMSISEIDRNIDNISSDDEE